ncbi:MAG: T9SS type A sorting domain-containing protein [Bacteroidota bacterium]
MTSIYIIVDKLKLSASITVYLLFIFSFSFARPVQTDTLKIMSYNTNDYGRDPSSSCPALITSNKHEYLKTILRYENPDILGLVKMVANPVSFSETVVIQKVLDSVCLGCYGHSVFTNFSGYKKEDMLYFKTSKLGYVGTTTIYSDDSLVADINLHTLYYKDPNLSVNHDTTFINVILIHAKSGYNNANIRAIETAAVMSWLNTHVTSPGNYIFMGDFNTHSSSEVGFQNMINSPNINTRFYDPPFQSGSWANNPTDFAHYLTESTRLIDFGDCAAAGGMTLRFDHILCTQSIIQGTRSLQYIPASFNVIGNDGNHTNLAITDPPINTSVPPDVLNALYYMSNHLPVSIRLAVTLAPIAIAVNDLSGSKNNFSVFPNPTNSVLHIKGAYTSGTCEMLFKNNLGQTIIEEKYETVNNQIDSQLNVSTLPRGIYFLEIISKNEKQVFKVQLF